MENTTINNVIVKTTKVKTGCIRKDIRIKNDNKKHIYGLWYRGEVMKLKNNENISLLFMKNKFSVKENKDFMKGFKK